MTRLAKQGTSNCRGRASNLSIERPCFSKPRMLPVAAHVERSATEPN